MRGDVDGFGGEVRGAGEFLGGFVSLGGGLWCGWGGDRGERVGEGVGGMGERTYFKEVGDAGLGEVDVGVGGIFGLGIVKGNFRGGEGRGGYHCEIWAAEIG